MIVGVPVVDPVCVLLSPCPRVPQVFPDPRVSVDSVVSSVCPDNVESVDSPAFPAPE